MNAGKEPGLKAGEGFWGRFRPACLAVFSAAALAATITPAFSVPATCDPKYWDSIKAQAWTEAEREIEQNQNYIYKADSILEYTCFDRFSRTLAGHINDLFDGDSEWGTAPPGIAGALSSLLEDAMKNYLGSNFKHKYLGDRSSLDYAIGSFGSDSSGYSYDCDQLNQVWLAAKCQDFANKDAVQGKTDTSAQDDFFYITDYKATDYRKLPSGAACAIAGSWAANLSLAANDAAQYPKETYNVYANFFNTTTCTDPPIIPTGITVSRPGVAAYPEIVCVVPGCASNSDGTKCTNAP